MNNDDFNDDFLDKTRFEILQKLKKVTTDMIDLENSIIETHHTIEKLMTKENLDFLFDRKANPENTIMKLIQYIKYIEAK